MHGLLFLQRNSVFETRFADPAIAARRIGIAATGASATRTTWGRAGRVCGFESWVVFVRSMVCAWRRDFRKACPSAIESVRSPAARGLQQGIGGSNGHRYRAKAPARASPMVGQGAPVIAVGTLVMSPRMTHHGGGRAGPIRSGTKDLIARQSGNRPVYTGRLATGMGSPRDSSRGKAGGTRTASRPSFALGSGPGAQDSPPCETIRSTGLVLDLFPRIPRCGLEEGAGDGPPSSCHSATFIKDFIQNSRAYARRDWLAAQSGFVSGAFSPPGKRDHFA